MPHLAAVLVAGQIVLAPAYAATLGHSRLVSDVGEPLRVTIPVTRISAAEISSLRVVPAPASEWTHAGLTPPVDLAGLQARLAEGYAPQSHVIQVWSDDVFNQPIADLLLDIHTSSGVQRYQVSLLARGGAAAIQAPVAPAVSTTGAAGAVQSDRSAPDHKPILVRRGDTMFAVAQRHAVTGVSVYQMMIALQRANPQAFIHENINLVKAGEQLGMPDMAALTAISDREARRLFHEQVVAFNAYRQGSGDLLAGDPAAARSLAHTGHAASPADTVSNVPESRTGSGDQLKLSSARPSGSAAAADAGQAGSPDSPQTGDSAGSLAHNMASGVSKAAHAATTHDASTGASELSGNAPSGATVPAGSTAASAEAGSPANGSADATDASRSAGGSNAAALDEDAQADDALAARKAITDAEQRVSQLEENVKNLNKALQSQGEAATDLVVEGAIGLRQSLTDVATAVTDATIGDEEYLNGSTPAHDADTASAPDGATETRQDKATTNTMSTITSWLQANLVGAITAILALIVLVIAWILRRANIAQGRTDSAVTPEMVKEKLDQINLDLNEPTINDSTSSR